MKTENRNEVLVLLTDKTSKRNEIFNKAFAILKVTPGKSLPQERHLNKVGFSETTLGTVFHELRKHYKIKDSEIRKFVNQANAEKEPSLLERFIEGVSKMELTLRLKLLVILRFRREFTFNEMYNNASPELIEYIEDKAPFIEFDNVTPELSTIMRTTVSPKEFEDYLVENAQYPEEFKAELENLRQFVPAQSKIDTGVEEEIVKLVATAPVELKQEIRFRDEFPFINDPNLLDEFKILVADKFNHYFAFVATHKELFDVLVLPYLEGKKPEDCAQIANDVIFELCKKAIGEFEMDQLIYDEFAYFKAEGKVLGKHPIFSERKLQETVDSLSGVELVKRQTLLKNYIGRDSKNADKAKTDAEKKKFSEKVIDYKKELVLIELRIEADAKK